MNGDGRDQELTSLIVKKIFWLWKKILAQRHSWLKVRRAKTVADADGREIK